MKRIIALNTPEHVLSSVKDEQFRATYNATEEGVEIFLHGVVGDTYDQCDAGTIAKMLSANRGKPVTLRVNSPGGLAFDGLALYNAMAAHDGPTTGIIEGLAASAASLAVIGCDTVKMYANATYHIHEGLSFAFGHIADLEDAIEWLKSFNANAVATYAAKTKRPEKAIAKELLGEGDGTKMNAETAKSLGYIDEIIPIKGGKKEQKNTHAERQAAMLNFRIRQHRMASVRK